MEFFERARDITWETALIAAFGATCRANGNPDDDANIQAMLSSGVPVCTVVGKSWTLHVTEVLRTSLDDNLRIIEESLAYLKSQGRRIIYDAEHFFDGYKAIPSMHWKRSELQRVAAPRRWCCATRTAGACRGKYLRSYWLQARL